MKAPEFLVRWFALKRLERELRILQKQIASQLAEMDRTVATMRDMKCPHCGRKRTET